MGDSAVTETRAFLRAFIHHEGGRWLYALCSFGLCVGFVLLACGITLIHGPRPIPGVKLPGFSQTVIPLPRQKNPPHLYIYARPVRKGENLIQLIRASGVPMGEVTRATHSMKKHFDSRTLMSGDQVLVTISTRPTYGARLEKLVIHPDAPQQIRVVRQSSGRYRTTKFSHPMTQTRYYTAKGKILNNLYAPIKGAGLPHPLIADLIHMYSYQIDFQRDLRPNDRFEVFYTMEFDESGRFSQPGKILYAALTLRGRKRSFWFHKPKNQREGSYYNSKGQHVKGLLMKTPLEVGRISSRFGMRRHPILGYTRMHSGVDFAAPTGTPVYAAGDGVVEEARRRGGYGNYVRIKHKMGYQTAYGHLHKFASGIKKNRRVRQGDIIAYVGSTGLSTGPHLHYEVIRHGRKINPNSTTTPRTEQLTAQALTAFQRSRLKIDALRQQLFARNPSKPQR